ncbi:bacterioferritin-associated ferredoxin, partial [Burkholderia pseudomallei]
LLRRRARWRRFAARVARTFALRDAARALPPDDTLLCRCEDVTIGAVRAHASARDAKLLTRCAMGACQGRVCGAAAHAYFGWDDAPPRPPFSPARIDTLLAASDDALL